LSHASRTDPGASGYVRGWSAPHSIRRSTTIARQRRTGNTSTSLRPVASSTKPTGGVISASSTYRVLQTGGRHLGRHTKGALQVQQVDGGFQDTDADRLAQGGSMARPK
jgi:hypothetical protein